MTNAALDLRYLLISTYKKLGLNESELVMLLVIDQLLEEGNTFIDAELLSLRMSMKVEDIDRTLTKLIKDKYIEFVPDGKTIKISLKPLEKILLRQYQEMMTKENIEMKEGETQNKIHNIYSEFEKYFGRSLSPLEYQKIFDWLEQGYDEKTIIDALKEVSRSKRKSMNAVDKTLLKMAARDDVDKEGYTTIDSKWNKNIEETMKIAKTKWLDDDEDC